MCSEIPLSVDGRTAIGAISWGMAGSLLREGEMCIMFYNETVVASPCPKDPADDQIVEGRRRIRLGPQTDPPRAKARVAVVEQQCSVEPALYVVADGDHTKQMPLTHGRRLHGRARELSPATVVVVEAEVVLERIREHAPPLVASGDSSMAPAPGRRARFGGHDRGPGGSGRQEGSRGRWRRAGGTGIGSGKGVHPSYDPALHEGEGLAPRHALRVRAWPGRAPRPRAVGAAHPAVRGRARLRRATRDTHLGPPSAESPGADPVPGAGVGRETGGRGPREIGPPGIPIAGTGGGAGVLRMGLPPGSPLQCHSAFPRALAA